MIDVSLHTDPTSLIAWPDETIGHVPILTGQQRCSPVHAQAINDVGQCVEIRQSLM